MEDKPVENTQSSNFFRRSDFPNLILIGSTASGKSTVGDILARLLGFGCIDIDQWITKESGKPISEIFKEEGEVGFRKWESDAIDFLNGALNHVIIAGGGIVDNEDNWEKLRKLGPVVWLATPVPEIVRRLVMKPDELRKRPLLADSVSIEDRTQREAFLANKLNELLERRFERYLQCDYILENSFLTSETCAQFIKGMVVQ